MAAAASYARAYTEPSAAAGSTEITTRAALPFVLFRSPSRIIKTEHNAFDISLIRPGSFFRRDKSSLFHYDRDGIRTFNKRINIFRHKTGFRNVINKIDRVDTYLNVYGESTESLFNVSIIYVFAAV